MWCRAPYTASFALRLSRYRCLAGLSWYSYFSGLLVGLFAGLIWHRNGCSGLGLEALLASSRSFHGLLPPVLVLCPLVAPGSWVIYWDGSHSLAGAGIGVMIGCTAAVLLVRLGVLVATSDATCTKALGPAFAALLLNSWFTSSSVLLFGNSQHVVDLLACSLSLQTFSVRECGVGHDLLHSWVYTVT